MLIADATKRRLCILTSLGTQKKSKIVCFSPFPYKGLDDLHTPKPVHRIDLAAWCGVCIRPPLQKCRSTTRLLLEDTGMASLDTVLFVHVPLRPWLE